VLGAFLGAGCWGSGDSLFRPRVEQPSPPPPAPTPDSPVNAVLLFQWCWEQRDLDHYRTLFTDDFRFTCALADSAGSAYRYQPCTREDELITAQHVFEGTATEPAASSITLVFDGALVALPDYRDGKTAEVHQYVQIPNLTLTVNRTDGSAYRLTGGAAFFLVRGDSAAIPQELKDQGFGPDKNRWYFERWDDQTNSGGPGAARTLPTRQMTWCLLKGIYH
jgi:hypothetical protein